MDSIKHLNISNSQIDVVLEELRHFETSLKQIKTRRKNLIEADSYTKRQEERLASKLNPEDFYKFRFLDCGIEIVYTNYCYDDNIGKWYRSVSEYKYSCKCYGWRPKKVKLKYCWENLSYGCFDDLNDAIKLFKKLCVELLSNKGCLALNPEDFI